MTPLAWIQMGIALIQAVSALIKDADAIPADFADAKSRLHAIVEALEA